ncbi:hypothetical protein ACIP5Z_09890 [Rothia terrae]|uniref:hypothetical protein n=1 Tax=Rothia terrae TaxID=396015 RepID=UPI0038302748
MSLTQKALHIQASCLNSFFTARRPDLNLNQNIIASAIQSTPGRDAEVIAAAWSLADQLAQRTGDYQTFGKLPEFILQQPQQAAAGETSAPAGSFEPCPAHPWDYLTNCKACHGEIKAGDRRKEDYGQPTTP